MNFRTPPRSGRAALTEAEVAAWVGLSLLPGVGPRTIARWIERAGSAEAAWRRLPEIFESRTGREEVVTAWRSIDPRVLIATAQARGMRVVPLDDPAYPALVRITDGAPPVLYVRGQLDDAPCVAVVGARRATPYGLAAAGRLAYDLALAGVTVVSGLARGIDAAAHHAALEAGGRTIAVLGTGADVTYPPEHAALADAIAAHGALVTEFPPGVPARPGHFPRRNRIISGLCRGVVVVEGAGDSGALVTVDYALEQGREVFAVPGSIFSDRSRAPHRLLREGARIVEGAEDVLLELGLMRAEAAASSDAAAASFRPGSDEFTVLALLDAGPRPMDDLVGASGLPAARVAAAVTMLEVRGLVHTLPGQMVMRNPGAGRDDARRGASPDVDRAGWRDA